MQADREDFRWRRGRIHLGLEGRFVMTDQPELSEAEWALMLELLQRERSELPVEIRHTRTSSVREELHRRQEMVQGLLQRLKKPTMA